MEIKEVKYLTSVVDASKILQDGLCEFAFVGRSNVGKSSLINMLCNRKNLALTSSTPGKTKMINYFLVNSSFKFVDLPGYGYSKTGKSHVVRWASIIEKYLLSSEQLKLVFCLIDCRIEPTDNDKMMIEFLMYNNIPFKIILTKIDKLAKSKVALQLGKLANNLGLRRESFFLSSNNNRNGREEILNYIEGVLTN